MFRNRDNILGLLAVLFLLLGTANALEYFFAGRGYLAVVEGKVTNVEHNTHQGSRGRMYAETRVKLERNSRSFSIYENANVGGYLDTQPGDTITLYIRHWYQSLYNFSLKGNIYYAEKAGIMLYNNMSEWRATSFSFMCYLGGIGLFLLIIFLDVARGNAFSKRIKKRILNKKGYSS
jgi:hypothetical protein